MHSYTEIILKQFFTGLILIFFFNPVTIAQNFAKYRIEFADKYNNPYSIEKPEEFLSQRAIHRRIRQNIAITESDLPVNPHYTDSLKSLGFRIINKSKWFNSVLIETGDTILLDTICKITFIDSVTLVKPSVQKKSLRNKFASELCVDMTNQTTQNNQILGQRDFVDGDNWVLCHKSEPTCLTQVSVLKEFIQIHFLTRYLCYLSRLHQRIFLLNYTISKEK